ncbi:GrpB protein [Bacteriovorax sp. BAL6_X]|uniref:GrpB family protein n=1 Tax=Bacteriovorax sp. BAL6_X TaxID=1201290 RepID=UPI000386A163|nr:GrpB family protein [Bacteriovorax sp. BAL6_X]EPZ49480.1 GrpB protein [Bacteriovorax sp. BAL6_X]
MSSFSIFEENGLGLLRDNRVRLVEHNPNWSKVFDVESKRILNALNLDSLKLYHCGSTAITGIVAKPILDIVGEVKNLDELDKKKNALVAIGYEYKGEYGIEGRRYSVLYNEDKTIGYSHLHIFKSGSSELFNHVLFKDYLQQNFDAALRYETVKKSLDVPRNEYSDAKTKNILELVEEAKSYFSKFVY